MAGDNRLVTENFLRLNFTPKAGITAGTNDLLCMDCDQIQARYNAGVSGITTTGFRLPSQNQLTALIPITYDTRINIFFDSSGSMNATLQPLLDMRSGNLKTKLLPMYNNDSALYDQMVTVTSISSERTFAMLNNNNNAWPEGKVIIIIFQDEASPLYHTTVVPDPALSTYVTDIGILRSSLNSFADGYYHGIVFQVATTGRDIYPVFKQFLETVKAGQGSYWGVGGLQGVPEVSFQYDITPGVSYSSNPDYYIDHILNTLRLWGYNV